MNAPLTVYNGRSNRIDIALTQGGVPVDAAFVTGAVLRVFDKKNGAIIRIIEGRASQNPNEASLFDYTSSAVVPGAGAAPIRILSFQFGLANPVIPPRSSYWCDLIIFSASDVTGASWAQFYLSVIEAAP